jgi:pimeloyl-ACP methyl ester carboxylesterase
MYKQGSIGRVLAEICLVVAALSSAAWSQGGLPAQGHYAELNGIKMYYETYGSGSPLILLHGFGGSSANWAPFISDLAKDFQVIAIDLRGHGRSTNPTKRFTHKQSALDVYALLDQLGCSRFKAMGISTGGMTLIHMATQQPSRVESMVLIGATIYFPEQARAIMRKATPDSMTGEEWKEARKIHKLGDEQILALRNEFYDFKDSYDDMNFTSPYLSTITAETLIIQGDRDEFFPVGIPVEMYRSIPHSYLWIIPNGGHVPLSEHMQEFRKVTREFLRGDWQQKKVE